MAPRRTQRDTWRLLLVVAPLPFVWLALDLLGVLRPAEELSLDLRFRLRGEIEEPARIVYVNFDEQFSHLNGVYPIDRRLFAEAAVGALDHGARAVVFDFVLTDRTSSSLVPREILRGRDAFFQGVLTDPSVDYGQRIILAANYNGPDRSAELGVGSRLPLAHAGAYDPATNGMPDGPAFPLWTYSVVPDGQGGETEEYWGRVGLINTDNSRTSGATPRVVPLFVETANEGPSRYHLVGRRRWLGEDTHRVVPSVGEQPEATRLELVREADGAVVASLDRVVPWTFWTASVEAVLAARGYESSGAATIAGDRRSVVLGVPGDEFATIPLRDGQLVEVNWFKRWRQGTQDSFSLAILLDLLRRKRSDDPAVAAEAREFLDEAFRDAYVLVGPTDPILQDLAPSPLEDRLVPKVSVHGNMISTLLSGRFLHRPGRPAEVAILFGLTILTAGTFLVGGHRGNAWKAMSVVALGGYLVAAQALFSIQDIVLPVVAPAGAAASTTLVGALAALLAAERQRGRIKGLFGTYLSPDLVDRMVESGEEPRLGGQSLEITAFFSDVEKFSTFSEILSPAQLVELMNAYLSAMTDILQEEGGTLDKYIGDAIVGMFGAPIPLADHAARACRAAARIQERQLALQEQFRAEGAKWPDIVFRMRTRIGLNSGLATVGNMGSHRRFNYTMMGDVVNLAARSESGAKHYGVYAMVSGETRAAAERVGCGCVFRRLDRIVVVGRSAPVDMHELVGLEASVTPETRACLAAYEEALDHYRARRWDEALALLDRSAALERFQPGRDPGVKTNPSLVLRELVLDRQANPPPADWDGTTVLTEK